MRRSRLLIPVFALVACVAICLAPASPGRAQSRPADPDGAWGAPAGTEPCASENLLGRSMAADPTLAARRELFDRLVQEAERKGLIPPGAARPGSAAAAITYVIPVAVHIVHQGGPENISDNQVLSQIYALNRDCANTPGHPFPAVNTGIQFCLAQNLPPASPVAWSTMPGVTRDNSPQTNHTYGNPVSEAALKAISYLPSNQYLNVWVVKTIAGGGGSVAGYATFPGTVPPTLDGIVVRYDAFGSNFTPYGASFTLLLGNSDGKITTHEVGHYLNLYHPFTGGCTPPGDQVSDTPPEAVNRTGCPTTSLTSCTAANDPIENFMDYTNDPCRFAFTAGQLVRMQAAIASYRSQLVSSGNLAIVGCSSGLSAAITVSGTQVCAGAPVKFNTPAAGAGYTYAWSFPGGSPASAVTESTVVSYAVPGIYPVTLTVTDGGSNSSTNSVVVYASACTPILNQCTHWVFPGHNELSFATGAPVALAGRIDGSSEPGAMISDGSGNLLFYSDGTQLFTSTNAVMPNSTGLLAGISSHNGVIVIPRPGSSTQYFVFTIRNWEDGLTANPANYTVVDMTLNAGLGAVPPGLKNIFISLPGSPNIMMEGQTLIPHCNGTDWWWITHGAGTTNGKVFVTLVTSAGPVSTTAYSIGMNVPNVPAGSITPTADGTVVAMINLAGKEMAAYKFDRTTGVPTTLLAPTAVQGWTDICPSPDGKLLYYSWYNGTVYGVNQYNIALAQTRSISDELCCFKPGPDGKIYMVPAGTTALHCINFPNNFNALNANECGLNKSAVPLAPGHGTSIYGGVPNMVLQCYGTAMPAQFSYTVTNCLTVNFHSVNCAGPYNWNFGDVSNGVGQNVSHTYAAAGTYTVTLTVAGASPSVATLNLTVGLQPVTLAGPSNNCASPSNYSAVGPPGYTYTWIVTGGSPSTWAGNNVDVVWSAAGGVITLTVTDSLTGCTSHLGQIVVPCPSCYAPPLNMTAWWPLDEISGSVATETVVGNNGSDINAPLHVSGKVSRARQFSGVNDYVRANDAPQINAGTGDFSIDAWVKTSVASGIQPIVDKRDPDPELGYMMYLKNGRLALRLGDGIAATGTEYWSGTTPLVADGLWHHVAVAEKRSATANGTRLYVDGALATSFPAYSPTANITNTDKFLIGAWQSGVGTLGYFTGLIDEVEFFQRAISTTDVTGIFAADNLGKCKEYCYVPTSANFCKDQGWVTLTMNVCNYTTNSQSYQLTFSGLTAGGSCTYAGPSLIQVLGPNPVTVPPSSCVPVQYKVWKPAGMPLYSTTCYQVTTTNTVSGYQSVCGGSVYAPKLWCNIVIGPPRGVGVGGTGSPARLTWQLTNHSGGPMTLPYRVSVASTNGGVPELPLVSLDGLDPGVSEPGSVNLNDGDSATVEVLARFTQPRGFRFYDVVLSMDEDGDGVPDNAAAVGLTYSENPAAVPVAVPGTGPAPVATISVAPNPVRNMATIHYVLPVAGQAEIALYDVVGRRVRSLLQASRPAGPGSILMDVSRLPRSVYFLRLKISGGIRTQRMVVVN